MYWEPHEINQLQTSFLRGESLKIMARMLNKSPGAVNKALTRFQIRPARKPKPVWSALLENARKPQSHRKAPPVISLSDTISWRSSGNKVIHGGEKNWVALPEVIKFLNQCGEKITRINHGVHAKYCINKRDTSSAQLLLRANQLRSEQNLPPFYVESLME